MDIKSLPRGIRAYLRSGANINNINQCVTELVLNSLDAKATAVAIRVNLLTFRIQVVDNGRGITKPNMNPTGIRYMTSKCQTIADLKKIKHFGYRGEALASICTMSKKISIISRADNSTYTYTKIYENGNWSTVELVKTRASQGTTVTIEGFMHNLPVRQNRVNPNLDLHEIKRNLEALAIIHPSVSFNLRNDSTGKIVLQSNKTRTVSQTLSNFYPDVAVNDLMEIKVSKSRICISGLIYKKLLANNKVQLIYLNKRPIVSPKIQNSLNSLLMKSFIGKSSALLHTDEVFHFGTSLEKTERQVYVINIRCPYSEVDLALSPSKTTVEFKRWNVVLTCIKKAVMELLQQENLINSSSNTPQVVSTPVPSFQSKFGVSQIQGAVKSIAAKRKIVETVAPVTQKCLRIDELLCSRNKTEYMKKISEVDEKPRHTINSRKELDSSSQNNLSSNEDHMKILTVAEVHNTGKTSKRKKNNVLLLYKNNNNNKKHCREQKLRLIANTADSIQVLPEISKHDEVKSKKVGKGFPKKNASRKVNTKANCFKILPVSSIKRYKRKNIKERPTLCGKTKTALGKDIFINFNESWKKNANNGKLLSNQSKIEHDKRNNIEANSNVHFCKENIKRNETKRSEDLNMSAYNSRAPNNMKSNEFKTNTSEIFQIHQKPSKPSYSKGVNQVKKDCLNEDKEKMLNIFDKHKNTQSLVINSDRNASESNVHSLLNSTTNTQILENQDKGKNLIMEMFLKSACIFPNEGLEITDNAIKTILVETTKENLITAYRNHNTTMMTASLKIMSRKTTVTNSLNPICTLRNDIDQNNTHNNDRNIHHQYNHAHENQRDSFQEKMVSKCIQTTMVEHQKEFKIDFKCFTQPKPNKNSKLTFFKSFPQNHNCNVTLSKYFKKSQKPKQSDQSCGLNVKDYCFKNDWKFNNRECNPGEFNRRDLNADFLLNRNLKDEKNHKIPVINFGKYAAGYVPCSRFENLEWLYQPARTHFANNYNNSPMNLGNYENGISNYFCTFGNQKKNFPSYSFRKPIKNFVSDYKFDFSHLDESDESYKHFMKNRNGICFPFIQRTNPLQNQQYDYHNTKNNWAGVPNNSTVPLYQSYNPNWENKLGIKHYSNYYKNHCQQPLSMINNCMGTQKWINEMQHLTRNKIQQYHNPEKFDTNFELACKQNPCSFQPANSVLSSSERKRLYESVFCDYKQESGYYNNTENMQSGLFQGFNEHFELSNKKDQFKSTYTMSPTERKKLYESAFRDYEQENAPRVNDKWAGNEFLRKCHENMNSIDKYKCGQFKPDDTLPLIEKKQLYESVFCDYGKVNDLHNDNEWLPNKRSKINDKMFTTPQLEEHYFHPNFFKNKIQPATQNKLNSKKQTEYNNKHLRKLEDVRYSPFFKKPTKQNKNQQKRTGNIQNPSPCCQNYHHKTGNDGNLKRLAENRGLSTDFCFKSNPSKSPFFYKASRKASIFEPQKIHGGDINQEIHIAPSKAVQEHIKEALSGKEHLKLIQGVSKTVDCTLIKPSTTNNNK